MPTAIRVERLTKSFQFAAKDAERGVFKNFFHPEKKTVTAVDAVSFEMEGGASVAFIGPNGAGKSTTIKMLTGILYPTSGTIRVLGLNPQSQRRQLSYKIGTVFGQRSQLVYNLPVRDSFRLFGKIYELSDNTIASRQKELVKLFDLDEFFDQPVRKLSLGQRMRSEIAVSLLHKPEIIFLDEPTIGLDVVAKRNLRETLRSLNQNDGTTIFLTSHDAGDIEALCERSIVMNDGKIILDEKTEALKRTYLTQKDIRIELKRPQKDLKIKNAKIIRREGNLVFLSVDTSTHSLNDVLKDILATCEVEDMDVENATLEEIIAHIYKKENDT